MNHAHESGVDPMGFPSRLARRRRVLGLTQEELADRLDVTRQAVQKWESGASQPGMEKLSALAETLDMSLDALVLGREAPPPPPEREGAPAGDPWENRETATQTAPPCPGRHAAFCRCWHYEYKSRRTLWGLPLVHIHLMSRGLCRAKGILAIGNVATGLVALGGFSFGLVSLGAISLGLLFSWAASPWAWSPWGLSPPESWRRELLPWDGSPWAPAPRDSTPWARRPWAGRSPWVSAPGPTFWPLAGTAPRRNRYTYRRRRSLSRRRRRSGRSGSRNSWKLSSPPSPGCEKLLLEAALSVLGG